MKAFTKLSATLIAGALAAVAAPAVAAETIYIETPATTTVYVPVETTTYYAVPETTTVYYGDATTVYGYRNDDDRITSEVIGNIAADPNINGIVGVQTENSVVTLDGRVSTPGQALRAGYDAHRADGVSEVQNRLRTRVGGQ